MKLLPVASRVVEPWKNGHGLTATVERTADWRVSVAEVSDDSPFSRFPGADRILMPLSPHGVVLNVNGRRRALPSFRATGFDGEDTVNASDVQGPTAVLNVIWLRGRCTAVLTAIAVDDPLPLVADGVVIAIVTAGKLTIAGEADLARLDAVRLENGEAVTLSGTGQLALTRIREAAAPAGGTHGGSSLT